MQDAPSQHDQLATMISDLSHTGELSMLYRMEIADAITELRAECQRRIDAAVTAEIANASVMFDQTVADLVKALKSADTYIDIGHYEMARNITRNAIRAQVQK